MTRNWKLYSSWYLQEIVNLLTFKITRVLCRDRILIIQNQMIILLCQRLLQILQNPNVPLLDRAGDSWSCGSIFYTIQNFRKLAAKILRGGNNNNSFVAEIAIRLCSACNSFNKFSLFMALSNETTSCAYKPVRRVNIIKDLGRQPVHLMKHEIVV